MADNRRCDALWEKLSNLGYSGTFSVESQPLVEQLVEDLEKAVESCCILSTRLENQLEQQQSQEAVGDKTKLSALRSAVEREEKYSSSRASVLHYDDDNAIRGGGGGRRSGGSVGFEASDPSLKAGGSGKVRICQHAGRQGRRGVESSPYGGGKAGRQQDSDDNIRRPNSTETWSRRGDSVKQRQPSGSSRSSYGAANAAAAAKRLHSPSTPQKIIGRFGSSGSNQGRLHSGVRRSAASESTPPAGRSRAGQFGAAPQFGRSNERGQTDRDSDAAVAGKDSSGDEKEDGSFTPIVARLRSLLASADGEERRTDVRRQKAETEHMDVAESLKRAQARHNELSSAFAALLSRLQYHSSERAEMTNRIQALEEREEQHRIAVIAATEHSARCQLEKVQLEAKLADAERCCERVMMHLTNVENQKNEFYETAAMKEEQRAVAMQHLEELTSALQGADGVHQKLVQELELRCLELQKVQGENVELLEVGTAGREVVQKIVGETQTLRSALAEAETEKQQLSMQWEQKSSETSALRREVASLTSRLCSAAEELLRVQKESDHFRDEVGKLRKMETSLSRVRNELTESEAAREELTSEMERLRRELKLIEEQKLKIKEELDQSTSSLRRMEKNLVTAQTGEEATRHKHETVKQQMADLAAALERSSDAALMQETETRRLQLELDSLKTRFEAMSRRRRSSAEDRMHHLEVLLSAQREKYHELQLVHSSLRDTCEALKRQSNSCSLRLGSSTASSRLSLSMPRATPASTATALDDSQQSNLNFGLAAQTPPGKV